MNTGSIDTHAMALLTEALEHPSAERVEWVQKACAHDRALAERVLSLLEVDAGSSDSILRTGGAGREMLDAPVPDRIGPYRVIEPIGRGGMGAIYKATRDTESFDHIVAIKVIRPGVMAGELIDRFQRERQILANLNHPNIARLYDGGETDEGAPYIVMEYIDGEPLNEWADTANLSLQDRLSLFRDLCGAVRHAHQNLIIHRDLTPSNVLVTKTGTVKLIDFGISKPYAEGELQASAERNSLSSDLSFTPGFAAPERNAGSAPNILSDIFSLGKLLEDLTRQSNRSPDLCAIINKSSATDPADRYASADGLIDDLDNLRLHAPVEARAGGAVYRLGKFLRRRRLPVLAACVFVIGLSGALAHSTLQFRRAEIARADADQRFNDVRDLANFMLFDLYDKLSPIHGNTEALESIADRSRNYLDQLSDSATADTELRRETAIGYKRLADVSGNPITANLGRRADTKPLLKVSIDRLNTLLEQNPGDPDTLRALGDAKFSQSVFEYIAEADYAASIVSASEGLAVYDSLLSASDATLADHLIRSKIAIHHARPYIWVDRGEEGLAHFEALIAPIAKLVTDNPDNEKVLLVEADFYSDYADGLSWHKYINGEVSTEALPLINTAIEKYRSLIKRNNLVGDHRRSMAAAIYLRGQIYADLGDFNRGLDDLDEAETIIRKLIIADPEDASINDVLEAILKQKAGDLASAGRIDEAIALSKQVAETERLNAEANMSDAGYWRDYGNTLLIVAEVYKRAGQLSEACQTTQTSLDAYMHSALITPLSDGVLKSEIAPLEADLQECKDQGILSQQ